jgi:hypothetical protein
LYEICFPEEEFSEHSHSKLEAMGIEIDIFERDDFHKLVFEGEQIDHSNKIEQLF